MKKRMITLAMALCISATMVVPASAAAGEAQKEQKLDMDISVQQVAKPFESNGIKEYGTASVKEAVVINGVTNYLYPTFDDIDYSLERLKNEIPEYYSLVDDKVGLKQAYDYKNSVFTTVDFYVDTAQVAVDQKGDLVQRNTAEANSIAAALPVEVERKLATQAKEFNYFFDIYENKAANEEILDYLATTPDPNPERLAYMLPYNSAFVREYFANATPSAAAAQVFSEPKGTAYATKWAYSHNPAYPNFGNKDCTNFVSQILVAGGINMHDMYPDVNAGWWCRKILVGTTNPYTTYKNSVTWSVADKFVRFMGTWGNEYSSFYTFSTKVKKGDFIAVDVNSDGSWNHMGYVTGIGQLGTYGDKRYIDFRVAQHSDCYNAWVSTDDNNWDVSEGNRYAIVRRNAYA